ncbi:cache domain-containing sensor histidine kinase [Paenibacillus pini]|uniref:HAMP domain-containing protein n=1 Tax=Paenibacillus pini JCM 16418 TaxID=1236976 RepID=W7YLM3_9BACL|nr:sensor histidine kinase [Paenibacillus pini]GAF09492.1 hypothetical protein JCM16418_3635 [Paenibacillus pini JCM 16418]
MKFRSIRYNLIQFMLVATIIPLILSISITYIHTKETIRKQALQENKQLIFQGKTNLANYLDNLNRSTLSVYSDANFLRNLWKIPDDYRAVAEIFTSLQNMQRSVNDIDQIYLHAMQSNQSTLVTSAVFPKREYRLEPYISTQKYEQETTIIEPTHKGHDYGFPPSPTSNSDKMVFTFHRSITNIPSEEILAVLAMDVKLDAVAAICNQLFDKEKEQLIIVDRSHTVIYSGNAEYIGKKLPNQVVLDQISKESISGFFEDSGAMHVYEQMKTPYAEWTIIKRIPNATLYERATQLTQINAAIALIALLLIIIGTLFISIRITEPIKKLTSYMNQIQSGQLDVNIEWNTRDETGIMFMRFRQMMDTINNLILREYRLELANKTNQLKALQAQINPHFLYNALQSIGTLALQNKVPRIYSLLNSLAKMMRYSMRNNDMMVALKDEVDYVQLFLELQQERFGDKLNVEIDLEPETLQIPIPKMILQPLVENYFKHGMDQQNEGTGKLSLISRLIDDHVLQIVVANNGASIETDLLSSLQQQLEKQKNGNIQSEWTNEGDEHIGIQNVLKRLQLYSGQASGLDIDNIEPNGVQITLEIHITEELRQP